MSIRRAMSKLGIDNPVRVARDGIEALEILRGENGHEPIASPFVILLDINMPRMNGHEFLDVVRNDLELRPVVVFMLTTSDAPGDVMRAYGRNVAGYIVKEDPYETIRRTFAMLGEYSRLVVLPT